MRQRVGPRSRSRVDRGGPRGRCTGVAGSGSRDTSGSISNQADLYLNRYVWSFARLAVGSNGTGSSSPSGRIPRRMTSSRRTTAISNWAKATGAEAVPAAAVFTDIPPVVPAKMSGLDLGPACEQCGGMIQRTGLLNVGLLQQKHPLRLSGHTV